VFIGVWSNQRSCGFKKIVFHVFNGISLKVLIL